MSMDATTQAEVCCETTYAIASLVSASSKWCSSHRDFTLSTFLLIVYTARLSRETAVSASRYRHGTANTCSSLLDFFDSRTVSAVIVVGCGAVALQDKASDNTIV